MTKVCVLAFSYYPADPRVWREAEALVEAGISVDVICSKENNQPRKEEINGVRIVRLPIQRKHAGKMRYIWGYLCFIILSFFWLSLLNLRNRYKLVHVHNMPDILVFCALIPRLTGAKVILDLHDPMPEVYMTKYSIKPSHPIIRLLVLLEKISIRFSNLSLTVTKACRDLFIARGVPEKKIHLVLNSPDETIFHKNDNYVMEYSQKNREKFIIMYHGDLIERSGFDIALSAVNNLREKIPNLKFHVYGDGESKMQFLELIDELNLKNIVTYYGVVSLESIAEAIESIDIGIVPNRKNPFTELNLPTRIFEYLSMGKPVIAPNTKGIMDYFDEGSLHFFKAGNTDSLANAILEVYNNPSKAQAVLTRGISVYQKHRWEVEKKKFIDLVTDLARNENH